MKAPEIRQSHRFTCPYGAQFASVPPVMNFGQMVEQWRALAGIGKKASTVKYHAEIAAILLNAWANVLQPVDAVTELDTSRFVTQIAHYSAPRYNACIAAIKFITPAAASLPRRPVKPKERAMLDQLAFKRLLTECDRAERSHVGLVVRFLAHTGLRINEARQLRWSDVSDDCIRVPGSISKNGKPRHIPFVNGIQETLERLRAVTGRRDRVLPQRECKRSLNTACQRAGLPHLSHHDFRHLFATRCIESGVDVPTAARWLGHQDGGALLSKTYFHLVDNHSREMAGRVKV